MIKITDKINFVDSYLVIVPASTLDFVQKLVALKLIRFDLRPRENSQFCKQVATYSKSKESKTCIPSVPWKLVPHA